MKEDFKYLYMNFEQINASVADLLETLASTRDCYIAMVVGSFVFCVTVPLGRSEGLIWFLLFGLSVTFFITHIFVIIGFSGWTHVAHYTAYGKMKMYGKAVIEGK